MSSSILAKTLVSVTATIALAAASASTAAAVAPSQAADPAATTTAGPQAATRTAPPAPIGAQDVGAMATSPYTSPGSTAGHVNPGQTYTCAVGNLCQLVWDPTTGNWELFRMYYCNYYSLSYWNDGGYFSNNQTSGTVATFYSNTGNWTDAAPTGQTYVNWDPVYAIRNC
jgi:hypothetical protein